MYKCRSNLMFLWKVYQNTITPFREIADHQIFSKIKCNRMALALHLHTSYSFLKRSSKEKELKLMDFNYTSPKKRKKVIDIWPNMTVAELSRAMEKPVDDMFELMTFVDNTVHYTNPSDVIDDWNTLCDLVTKANFRWKIGSKTKEVESSSNKDVRRYPAASPDELQIRPPVVTIMGHVDHGKTTLLDYLRKSSIVSDEFGGITQHIGAFSVAVRSSFVTFLDTPGHAAFTAMRSRGAHCTDIVVLVVAADDGVMEQTVESIAMARDAKVPIVVAINKIDKPCADIERTKRMLMVQGLVLEEFGGDIQAIPISAIKGTNVSQLMEAIMVQAELANLKAAYGGFVEGVIIESKLDRYRGKLSTILIQRGTLKKGCVLTAGLAWCKVKAMYDDKQKQIVQATPSTPVEVVGWQSLPIPGDVLIEVESEQRASEVMRFRQRNSLVQKAMNDLSTIENVRAQDRASYKEKLIEKRKMGYFRKIPREVPKNKQIEQDNGGSQLNIVIKSDVEGSLEALTDVLKTYHCSLCDLSVVHSGVGNVSLKDVEIAASFSAIVYGFNVEVLPDAQNYANCNSVTIKHQNIIYRFLDDLKNEINLRLPPKEVEEVTGEAVVLELFLITEGKKKKIPVAGCRCVRGELRKASLYKVIRNGEELHRGTLDSMKNLKVEVNCIKKDQHCGLKFDDQSIIFEPGDVIQAYRTFSIPQEVNWNPF